MWTIGLSGLGIHIIQYYTYFAAVETNERHNPGFRTVTNTPNVGKYQYIIIIIIIIVTLNERMPVMQGIVKIIKFH